MTDLITFESSNQGLKLSSCIRQASPNGQFLILDGRYYCLVMLLVNPASKAEACYRDPLQGVYVAISRHSNESGYQDQLTASNPTTSKR